MTSARRVVAHTIVALFLGASLAAGCSDSHGRDTDAGSEPGPDAASPDGGLRSDAGSAPDSGWTDLDAGPRGTCDADDARAAVCPELLCDGIPRWYWNGDDCFWIDCGACEGTDCATRGAFSESECLAQHAGCEPALCRTTGGTWMWWAEECGHYQCGRPVDADCLVGMPVCDCGPDRIFDPGAGCVAVDCPTSPPRSRQQLCTDTGGSWDAICCDTTCGELCPLACASPACDCGPGRVMDDARGCIESAECHERSRGESCMGDARCEEGTICCEHCGGAGCAGPPTCVDPTCDADPHTDTCGNRDDVP